MEYFGKCSCIHCKEVKSAKGIFVHVDRSHLNKNHYSSGNNGKYKELSEVASAKRKNKEQEYYENPNTCLECQTVLPFLSRNKFCSHTCSATFNNNHRMAQGLYREHSTETKNKIKLAVQLFNLLNPKRIGINPVQQCNHCANDFIPKRRTNKFCSIQCVKQYRRNVASLNKTDFQKYRVECSFKFSLNDFPNEFDFSLIDKYGWYKAKNKGDNLYGVSRDHMVSVRYGFDNNIDPRIISHPANCKLMKHNENVSKYIDCSISVDQLLNRIKEWDEKYH